MQPPKFWQGGRPGFASMALHPLSRIVAGVTARRMSRPGWGAPVPVICCGNATVGGAGKTTLALDLASRLRGMRIEVHLLTRGYGGAAQSVLRVDPRVHDADMVGDEALLLAEASPAWVGADRAASARQAIAAGAQMLLMDDGLQNPGLAKTLSLLVIDGATGFGNGQVLPAGPLREPVTACAARSHAAILIGDDEAGALAKLPRGLPVLTARLIPGPEITALTTCKVLAFAGIARPEKFFSMLEKNGILVADRVSFPDHHRFSNAELSNLLDRAAALGAIAVTTPKDHVRIRPALRQSFRKIGVGLAWEDEAALDRLLRTALA